MTAPGSIAHPNAPEGDIAQGDHLARNGEWSAALTHWRIALDGPDAARASERMRWFLRETGSDSLKPGSGRTRRPAYRALLAAAIAAGMGTVVTMLGIGRSGIEGTTIAAVAWTCFAVAIGLTLFFARLLMRPPDCMPSMPIDGEAIAVAMTRASAIERAETSRRSNAPRSFSVRN